ncbi:MAG: hypothetical protein FWC64_05730 [Treponema sp.]|nr:hypothetical protein [Treponema sp.]
MSENEIAEALKGSVPIPAGELPRLFELLRECRKESEMTQREVKKYEAMKEVMLKEITGKYAFYEFLFSNIFAERAEAIKKDFEIIDQGIKRNNRGLVAAGVSGLSQVVASSPIADMEKLRRMLG